MKGRTKMISKQIVRETAIKAVVAEILSEGKITTVGEMAKFMKTDDFFSRVNECASFLGFEFCNK